MRRCAVAGIMVTAFKHLIAEELRIACAALISYAKLAS